MSLARQRNKERLYRKVGVRPSSDPDIQKAIDAEVHGFELQEMNQAVTQVETYVKISNKVSNTVGDATTLVFSVSSLLHILKIMALAVPVVGTIVTAASVLLNVIKLSTGLSLAFGEDSKERSTGVYNIVATIAAIAFAILTVTTIGTISAVLVLTLVVAASETVLNFWDLVSGAFSYLKCSQEREELQNDKKEFYNLIADCEEEYKDQIYDIIERYRAKILTADDYGLIDKYPSLKLILDLDNKITEGVNAERERKGELCHKMHKCAEGVFSHLSAIITLFCPPVGLTMLAVFSVYSILNRFDCNPFKWLGNKLFGNPFDAKEHHSTADEIRGRVNRISAGKLKKAESNVNLQQNAMHQVHEIFPSSAKQAAPDSVLHPPCGGLTTLIPRERCHSANNSQVDVTRIQGRRP